MNIYTNSLTNRFLAASAFPQHPYPILEVCLLTLPLKSDKDVKEPPCHISDSSGCLCIYTNNLTNRFLAALAFPQHPYPILKRYLSKVVLLLFWALCSCVHADNLKKVYVTPGFWGQLFAIDSPLFNRDGTLDVLYQLREEAYQAGYEILQADSLDHLEPFEYLIVFDVFLDQLPAIARYPKEKLILFLWEPPSVIPENFQLEHHRLFSKIYTWNDDLVDNKRYFKFYYPVMNPMTSYRIPFAKKTLCTLVACNKYSNFPGELYSERRQLIDFYEHQRTSDFFLFGKWWPTYLLNYGGAIEKKIDTLRFFKFCYAYENIGGIRGYITEKIFDCFFAGVVPIYWGAPNITSYIPANCFIARTDFTNDNELYSFLSNQSEEQYADYLWNIQIFLISSQAKLYSKRCFIDLFMKLIAGED